MSKVKNIIVVCWGNIYRSVIAEELLRKIVTDRGMHAHYRIESRGIQGTMGVAPPEYSNLRSYQETYAHTSKALEAYSIKMPENKISTPISQDDIDHADKILVLGDDAYQKLRTEWRYKPAILKKMFLLSKVEDPHNRKDERYLQDIVQQIADDVNQFAHDEL